MAEKEEEKKKITIIPLNPDAIKGVYVNNFAIGASRDEGLFVLDGQFISPPEGKIFLVSRMLIPLPVAKVLAKEMTSLLKLIEKEHGEIPEPEYEIEK